MRCPGKSTHVVVREEGNFDEIFDFMAFSWKYLKTFKDVEFLKILCHFYMIFNMKIYKSSFKFQNTKALKYLGSTALFRKVYRTIFQSKRQG